jgi:hypothetical protein
MMPRRPMLNVPASALPAGRRQERVGRLERDAETSVFLHMIGV